MRLSEFIRHEREQIIAEWQTFAATLTPAADTMTALALRDHASEILDAIAKDLQRPQSAAAQSAKSKGQAPVISGAPETAAQTHALLRAIDGFDIIQLVAEYRALRASVLRLWLKGVAIIDTSFDDMIRFNEAIDQAVAESVGRFHALVEHRRHLLLGTLSHDMRTPLSAVVAAAEALMLPTDEAATDTAVARLRRGTTAMLAMLDDLVEYNSAKLGISPPAEPEEMDFAATLHDEIEQLRAVFPARNIEVRASGRSRGRWDPHQIRRVVRNLVGNALRYGREDQPVDVELHESAHAMRFSVANEGPAIDAAMAKRLFDPLARGDAGSRSANEGLGLGLYIVHELVRAHGGTISVHTQDSRSTFTVTLPYVPEGSAE